MKELYEIGVVIRGTILVNHYFKDIPGQKTIIDEPYKDPRGLFISAINTFLAKTFNKNKLEYLESGNFLLTFKISEIKAKDNPLKEQLIIYGLIEKNKNPEKLSKIFLKKVEKLLEIFIERYNNKNLYELEQFKDFETEIIKFFR